MLKLLSSSCLQSRAHFLKPGPESGIRTGIDSTSQSLRVLSPLGGLSGRRRGIGERVFFCSDSSDGSGKEAEVEAKTDESEAEGPKDANEKPSSAIVPAGHRLGDYLTVLAIPLPHRPLFPGFYMPIYVKDPKLLEALHESLKWQAPYAGAFLVKDEPEDRSVVSSAEMDKNVLESKGKDLYNRLHDIGTLVQIQKIVGDQVSLIGHRRLRITEMVSEDLLTVKVDHLKDEPYDKDDDVIKATSFEVISTLRDVLKTSSFWRYHVQVYNQTFRLQFLGQTKCNCSQCLKN